MEASSRPSTAAIGISVRKSFRKLADMGYYHGAEIKACEEAGMTVYIQKVNTSANTVLGLFGKERFVYEPQEDCYRCPAGEKLTYHFDSEELGRKIRYYWTTACNACQIKAQCTRNKEFRRITRWVDEEILERMEQRVKGERGADEAKKADRGASV